MTGKHTPGPWRVNKYGSVGTGRYDADPIIAHIEPLYDRKDEGSANALLIAAAPELLEALEYMTNLYVQFVEAVNHMGPYKHELGEDERAVRMARAAIRKARGEE